MVWGQRRLGGYSFAVCLGSVDHSARIYEAPGVPGRGRVEEVGVGVGNREGGDGWGRGGGGGGGGFGGGVRGWVGDEVEVVRGWGCGEGWGCGWRWRWGDKITKKLTPVERVAVRPLACGQLQATLLLRSR